MAASFTWSNVGISGCIELMRAFTLSATPAAANPSLMPPMAEMTTSAMPEKLDENELIAPEMFVCPMLSIILAIALAMRFCALSMAVPMPPVASFACCANDANPLTPFESRSTIALLKSPMETVPFWSAV